MKNVVAEIERLVIIGFMSVKDARNEIAKIDKDALADFDERWEEE